MTAWDMWEHRNSILHAPDGINNRIELEKCKLAIETHYALGAGELQNKDKFLLQQSLPELLKKSDFRPGFATI